RDSWSRSPSCFLPITCAATRRPPPSCSRASCWPACWASISPGASCARGGPRTAANSGRRPELTSTFRSRPRWCTTRRGRRRAAARVAAVLLGDVLTIVAGHEPRLRIRVVVLIEDAAVAEGDHGDAPGVAGRLADHDGPPGQNAASPQHGNLIRTRCDTDGA